MTRLSRRAHLPERMDDPDLPQPEYEAALRDLQRVNRVTGTHRPTLAWLGAAVARLPPGVPVSVLDVACGRGDFLRVLARRAAKWGRPIALAGIDANERSTAAAAALGGPIRYRTGDVFADTPDPAPDFIVSSQFAHHLSDEDAVRFLRWCEAHARRGWFISDLHRTRWAFHGFPLLCRMVGWHAIVRDDGAASIARAFRPPEWRALLQAAAIDAAITRHPLSRLCVGRLK